jgi:hypothetical protein
MTPFQQWEAAGDEATTETAAPAAAAADEAPQAETAPDSEPEKKQTQEASDDDDEKLPKGLRKRFQKLTGKIRDLEAQLTAKPPAAAPQEVKPGPATPPAGKPKAENFATYEEYTEALTEWTVDQREAKRTQAEAKRAQDAEVKTRQEQWLAKVADAKERYPDWKQVVETDEDRPMTGVMQQTIFEMESGADVVYYLAQNPDELKRIAKLSPTQQAAALGKIEDKLDLDADEPESKKPAVTKAPAPARTVRGSSASDAGKEPDPKNFPAWNRWYERQQALKNS